MKKSPIIMPLILAGMSIHLLNNRIFSNSRDKLKKKSIKANIYNWKFGSVSYRVNGVGPTILLIHDTFSGASSIEYDRIFHQLSKKYKVYCIDLLGYGYSEKSNLTYTAFLYVQLINDFIEDIIRETSIDVITSGYSHIFALFASQQSNNIINKCIMINPADLRLSSLNPSARDRTIKYILELPFIGTTLYNLFHNKNNYKKQLFFGERKDTMSYYIDQFYHNAHFESANARFSFASNLTNFMNLDIKNVIKESSKSLYIINGSNRQIDYNIIQKQYTDLNPSIECAIVNQSSDFPHLENPYATYDLINLFLQD